MTKCPECAQLLAPEARACPACGHDLRARPLADARDDRDEEQDNDELLAAVVQEGAHRPPPPWVPSLEDRMKPKPNTNPEVDVVPAPRRVSWWRRLSGR
ncbi:MAG TPA: zinc ribbon domain-containing protein [Acidimicrobiales bacterium]